MKFENDGANLETMLKISTEPSLKGKLKSQQSSKSTLKHYIDVLRTEEFKKQQDPDQFEENINDIGDKLEILKNEVDNKINAVNYSEFNTKDPERYMNLPFPQSEYSQKLGAGRNTKQIRSKSNYTSNHHNYDIECFNNINEKRNTLEEQLNYQLKPMLDQVKKNTSKITERFNNVKIVKENELLKQQLDDMKRENHLLKMVC